MEPAGVVINVVGLASLSSSYIGCFDYIQFGQSFGADYGKCLLRLDIAKMRLSRWGEALGIAAQSQDVSSVVISPGDYNLAQNLLRQIQDTFKTQKRYSGDTKDTLNFKAQRVTVSSCTINRPESTSLLRKARWTVYEKRKFGQLIAEVTGFIDKLVDLFPVKKEVQVQLCQQEVSEITEAEDLTSLQIVAGTDDGILRHSIEAEQARRGHVTTNWKAGEQADVWIGDENEYGVESKGHHASDFAVSGSAKVRSGNKNKGRSSMDA